MILARFALSLGCFTASYALAAEFEEKPLFTNPATPSPSCRSYAQAMAIPLPTNLPDAVGHLCSDPALEARIQALAEPLKDSAAVLQTVYQTRGLATRLTRIRSDAARQIRRSTQYLKVCRDYENGLSCFRSDLDAKAKLQLTRLELLALKSKVAEGVRFTSCSSGPGCMNASSESVDVLKASLIRLEQEVDKSIASLEQILDVFHATSFVIDRRQ